MGKSLEFGGLEYSNKDGTRWMFREVAFSFLPFYSFLVLGNSFWLDRGHGCLVVESKV